MENTSSQEKFLLFPRRSGINSSRRTEVPSQYTGFNNNLFWSDAFGIIHPQQTGFTSLVQAPLKSGNKTLAWNKPPGERVLLYSEQPILADQKLDAFGIIHPSVDGLH